MKKFFVFFAALVAFVASAQLVNAEEKPHVQGFISNKFWDNWEIQAGAGPTFMLNTGSASSTTGNGSFVSGAGYIGVAKWFHPVFGIRFAGEGGKFTYLSQPTPNVYGENEISTAFIFVHPDFMVNLSNWIGGYKEGRVYNAILTAGAGLAVTSLDHPKTREMEFAFNFGLQNRFNVCKSLSLDLTVNYMLARAHLFPTHTLPVGPDSGHFHALNVYVGFTYRFNRRTFDRSGATEDEAKATLARLASAEQSLAAAESDNARLKKVAAEQAKALEAATAQVAERDAALKAAEAKLVAQNAQATSAKEAVSSDNFDEILFYLYGHGVLNANNKTRLDLLAEHIKNSKCDKVYKIEGFADPQTGSKKANERLAGKRARLVYEYLLSKGVSESKIEWKNCGTQELPFNSKEQNRVVVVF
ncbi:MAG: OmpA family protein [Alistipes sp.]|nr:OmpA family protein [Alistipes sp.]